MDAMVFKVIQQKFTEQVLCARYLIRMEELFSAFFYNSAFIPLSFNNSTQLFLWQPAQTQFKCQVELALTSAPHVDM